MTCLDLNYPKLNKFAKNAVNGEFVVIGAARGGWYAIQVLRHFGLTPKCISDMCPQSSHLLGVPILNHDGSFQKKSKTLAVIALLEPKSAEKVSIEIRAKYEFVKPQMLMDEIIHFFMTRISNRSLDHSKFWTAIEKYKSKEDSNVSVSPTISYVMTEKCSLNCENCGAFVPDIDDPETFEANSIIQDIKRYCNAFDVVHHVALQGGEPFLHKNIQQVVKEVSKIPNLLFVDIVTNGTINPKETIMNQIYDSGTAIVMSDYGEHSPKKEALVENCTKHNVFLDYHVYTERLWGAQFPIEKRNRSPKENIRTYRECISDQFLCCQIMDGQLHRCSFSNFTNRLKYIPDFEDDYIDMNTISNENLDQEIRKIALRKGPLKACDYCPGPDREQVAAGVQIPKQKKQRRAVRVK